MDAPPSPSPRLQGDPVCVAAREAGKKVVTENWVEDSFQLGELADEDRVRQSRFSACIKLERLCLFFSFSSTVYYESPFSK
jgi:hypothetical protein